MVHAFQVGHSRLLSFQALSLDLLLLGGLSCLTMLLAVGARELLVASLSVVHEATEVFLGVALTWEDQVELVAG